MGRLSTHILDVTVGKPAEGVALELHELAEDGGWRLLRQTATNRDGRTDAPLLAGAEFRTGTYMLTFHVGPHFQKTATEPARRPFLDVIPLRFFVSEPEAHYHVPLLVSPWSYSTYRGS